MTLTQANNNVNEISVEEFNNKYSPINNYFIIDANDFVIQSPKPFEPVFVEIGSTMTITIKQISYEEISAYISTAYDEVIDEIWLDIININNEQINVQIPLNTPEELYNLTIVIEENDEFISYTQPRCVKVLEEIDDTYSFIHLADLHVGDIRGFTEGIQETIGHKSIKKCIEEINLLEPDFVIITGDLVFGQLYPFEYRFEYPKLWKMLLTFEVPVFLSPGNHDGYNKIFNDGFRFWEQYFGSFYYSFDYGNHHFQSINSYDMSAFLRFTFLFIPLNWGGSISDEQLDWIESDLQQINAERSFMFIHHNPLWNTNKNSLMLKDYYNRENLLNLIDSYDIDMVLAGHVHWDSVNITNDTVFISTTTPQSETDAEDGYWGYRLISIENGDIASYNYKEPKYSIPSYRINITQDNSNSAMISNDLDMDINAHVEFVLPLGDYSVNIGEIIMQRSNEYLTEIYVKAPIESNSEVNIIVS
jgi:3',5'-cyclic AMP phosphodiesterase CpdA